MAENKSKKEPLLQMSPINVERELIMQNTSRRFFFNNKRKMPKIPLDLKYQAVPIQEVKSEN